MKPIIGVSSNYLTMQLANDAFPFDIDLTLRYFSQAIEKAGGVPVIIPITGTDLATDFLSRLDGIIFTGGRDIDPQFYGEEALPGLAAIFPPRDEMELALFQAALALKKPVLGICRGLQLINVALGGSLYQHLPNEPFYRVQHSTKADPKFQNHTIEVTPGSYLASLLPGQTRVNSYHHQGVKQLADKLTAVAYSSDQVVEALEWMDANHSILAVQWHPEMNHDFVPESQLLFNDLVERARQSRQG